MCSSDLSSGEESGTLQMIIQDFFKNRADYWDTQILATDISTQVLDKALAGVYSGESVAALPEAWKKSYFMKQDEQNYALTDAIKNRITYRRFNLMDDHFPFKKPFHVIFCRNVMIYFDNPTRNAVVEKFYNVLEDGGYLFIGHSESLHNTDTLFKYIRPAVYQKI